MDKRQKLFIIIIIINNSLYKSKVHYTLVFVIAEELLSFTLITLLTLSYHFWFILIVKKFDIFSHFSENQEKANFSA